MTLNVPFRVRQTANTAGTGTITLIAADTTLYRSLATHYGSGTVNVLYTLQGPLTSKFYEIGVAPFNGTANTLARSSSTIIASSNSNSIVNIPSGYTYDVWTTDFGGYYNVPFSGNVTMTRADGHLQLQFVGGSAATLTLPTLAETEYGFDCFVVNRGTAVCTIATQDGAVFNGVSTYALQVNDAVLITRGVAAWQAVVIGNTTKIFNNGAFVYNQNITVNGADPSGGNDGDIWFKV